MSIFNKLFNSEPTKTSIDRKILDSIHDFIRQADVEHRIPIHLLDGDVFDESCLLIPMFHKREKIIVFLSVTTGECFCDHPKAVMAKQWDELSIDAQEALKELGYFRVELDSSKAIDKTSWDKLPIETRKELADKGYYPLHNQ